MTLRTLTLCVALCGVALGQDTPKATVHVVQTQFRSLGDCPRKHVITSQEAYARVVDGLEGAPDAPDFSTHVMALIVFSSSDGGAVEVGAPTLNEGALRVPAVVRQGEAENSTPTLHCVFLKVPAFEGGLEVAQRRELGKGRGYVEKSLKANDSDRLEDALPELGPDLELNWELEDGKPAPPNMQLLHQVRFVKQPELKPRSTRSTIEGSRIMQRFPSLRLDVEHLYAVFYSGTRPLRTRNPLRVTTKILGGANATNPPRIKRTFILEPVPGH